jgi:hypothetical protein
MVSKVKVDSIETTAGTGTIALNNQLSGMTVASLPSSGALPALDGSALTNLPAGGVTGIVSSANATAITITSAERVGINKTVPDAKLEVVAGSETGLNVTSTVAGEATAQFKGAGTGAVNVLRCHNTSGTELFRVLQNGRGLSQFTAKAWVNFNGSGTLSVRDSHGVSSVSDLGGTGQYQVNFSNNMANTNYSAVTGGIKGSYGAGNRINDMTTSKFAIDNWSTSGYLDATIVTAIVFGD